MKQQTFINYEKEPPFAANIITTVDTVCPSCRTHIRFVVPDNIALRDNDKYVKHLEKEINRLHFELGKMDEIRRHNRGCY